MTDAWINAIDLALARETLDVLDDIVQELDLLAKPLVISPYVPNMGIGQEDNVREWKMRILRMLEGREVIRRAEYHHERGGRPGIWIDADEEIVRRTHGLLRDRIHGRAPASASAAPGGTGRVFVVCGRDGAATQAVARFLERLGVHPVI